MNIGNNWSRLRSPGMINFPKRLVDQKRGQGHMEINPILEYIKFEEDIRMSLVDKNLVIMRHDLADFTSSQFLEVAAEITKQESSKEEEKIDKAVSILLRIGSFLISGANDLFISGNIYAAAALLRQLVEIESLAWAFGGLPQDQRTPS